MKQLFFIALIVSTFFVDTLFAAKNLYVSYEEHPSQVFKNQRFEVVVKALVTTSDFDYITTYFSDVENLGILNPDRNWEKINDNTYENRFFFKAKDSDFKIPRISVSLIRDYEILETTDLESIKIDYSDIAKGDERFSSIIAKDLNVKAYKTKQYNNKESLTIIDIDAINSNLEDFNLKGIEEQGVSQIKDEYPNQNMIYYFVMPVHKKKIVFNYYNTDKKSLVPITVPLVLENELVSTQTDLNPHDSSFEKYKKMALVAILIVFILMFVWKRKKIYFLTSAILFVIVSIYLMPNETAVLKSGSNVYILPTKNSTIFFRVESQQEVEILNTKKDFVKIMGIDNNFIGWVKEEDFGED